MKQTAPVWSQFVPWTISGVLGGLLIVVLFRSTGVPQLPDGPPALVANADTTRRTFDADAAIMVRFVRPEMQDQYEAALAQVKEALARSLSPTRQRQAVGWRVFRAEQTATNGDLIYVFEIDSPVKDADYTISRILAEAFPAQADSLYRRYAESYSGPPNILDLQFVDGFAH